MLRFRIKKVASIVTAGLLLVVMYNYINSKEHYQYTQKELIQRMNVYDDFGQLSENRQKAIEKLQTDQSNRYDLNVQKPKQKNKTGVRGAVDYLIPKSKKNDYSQYTDVLSMDKPKYLSNYKNPCWKLLTRNTTKIRCLPYFYILGVDKCGTTDLWSRIVKHPEIIRNSGIGGKETHWWSWRRFGFDIWVEDRTPWPFEEYVNAFDDAGEKIESVINTDEHEHAYHPYITGEGSPTIFWDFTGWDHMPQNDGRTADDAFLTPHAMKHLTPNSMFVLLFRNPTERLYSDYIFLDLFRPVHNISVENFHNGVLKSIKMFEDCQLVKSTKSCLFDKHLHMYIPVRIFVGMYVVYLKEWFKVFNRNQFLILQNEEYSKNIKEHVLNVFHFLDLKKITDEDLEKIVFQKRAFEQSNTKKKAGTMWPETRQTLNTFYKKYNEELSELLGDKRWTTSSTTLKDENEEPKK